MVLSQFGKKDLFEAIHDSFIQSEDYKKSLEKLDENIIKENSDKLRARGKELLLANKAWGGKVGIIPGLDWVLQKFAVKKNATKKLGQLFGIDVRFVEDNKTTVKKKNKEKKRKKKKTRKKKKKRRKKKIRIKKKKRKKKVKMRKIKLKKKHLLKNMLLKGWMMSNLF